MAIKITGKAGRIFGLVIIIFWTLVCSWLILLIPIGLYYNFHIAPDWLNAIYSHEIGYFTFFTWEWGSVIIMTVLICCVGGAIVWIGWQTSHPINSQNIALDIDDRRDIANKTKALNEKILNDLHNKVHEEFQKENKKLER